MKSSASRDDQGKNESFTTAGSRISGGPCVDLTNNSKAALLSPIVENVACTVCGCVCDDLRMTVDNNRITRAEGACKLAEQWFLDQNSTTPPAAALNGREVTSEVGLQHAIEILRNSRAPLIYGLSRSSTPGQRAAVSLGDHIGATIDTTASLCHAPSILALQSAGESTCSLGEIRNRADLVIFWGSNPLDSHPRHFERYSVDPVGEFVPGGRDDRFLVVVDIHETPSTAVADLYIPMQPGRDFEALWTLRGLLQGKAPAAGTPTGASLPMLEQLAERMRSCRCGVVFFGLGLSRQGLGHLSVDALLRLVADLNATTRFHARRMRIPGDVTGADSLLCWQTGYPFSVNLGAGYPRYNPGEFSANDLLERGEVDSCLLVGSEGITQFSDAAVEFLKTIPTIVLDYPNATSPITPHVLLTTAVYGVHRPGTAYRMDEIPIPLRSVLTSELPSDGDVLNQIEERLRQSL